MGTRLRSLSARGAFGCGILAAVVALHAWHVSGGSVTPGAAVGFWADPSATVALEPAGLLFGRVALRPARPPVERVVTARNATGGPLSVKLRALAETDDLDAVLAVRLRLGTRTIFEGPLARLRSRGTATFVVPSHATRRLSVRAWIPRSIRHGYEARAEDVHLRFGTGAVR